MSQPVEFSFSARTQREILALVVRCPEFVAKYPGVVRAGYFTDPIDGVIAHAYLAKQDGTYSFSRHALTQLVIGSLRRKAEVDQLAAIKSRIKSLYRLPLSEKFLTEEVVRFAQHQAAANAVLESAELVSTGKYDQILDNFRKALQVGTDVTDMGIDLLSIDPRRIMRTIKTRRVPTGYSHIDDLLGGGLGCGELGIILGPTKRGKSIIVQDIAAHVLLTAKTPVNVVIVTLEMSQEKYARRLYTRFTGIGRDDLSRKGNTLRKKLAKIFRAMGSSRLLIKQWPTKTAGVADIRGYLRRLIAKGVKPTVLLVDYADLLKPVTSRSDQRFELSEIYTDLRGIASEFDIPVWTPSQTNRDGYQASTVGLEHIANDFNKATIADFVMTICQTPEEKQQGKIRFMVAANRDGEGDVMIDALVDYQGMHIETVSSSAA